MFNSVNNPFNRPIESSTSSDSNRQHQQEKKESEKKYLEQEENDEVKLGGLPILTEDDELIRQSRLVLLNATKTVLSNGMNVLGIEPVKKF